MTYVTLVARRAIGYDAGVAFGFGAVFRPVRAIGSGDQHQALPVQAKTVVAVGVMPPLKPSCAKLAGQRVMADNPPKDQPTPSGPLPPWLL